MAKLPEKTRFRTRDELAKSLGMAVRTLATYLAAGMPGAPGAYCLEDAENWLVQRAADLRNRRRNEKRYRRGGGGLVPR